MTRINKLGKRGSPPHFTKEMDDFFLKIHEYETWAGFCSDFRTRFDNFSNGMKLADMSENKLISKLRARNQTLKKIKKESK